MKKKVMESPKAIKKRALVYSAAYSYSGISDPCGQPGIPTLLTVATDSSEVSAPLGEQWQAEYTRFLKSFFLNIQEKYDVNIANDTRGIILKSLSGYSLYFLWKFYERSFKFM